MRTNLYFNRHPSYTLGSPFDFSISRPLRVLVDVETINDDLCGNALRRISGQKQEAIRFTATTVEGREQFDYFHDGEGRLRARHVSDGSLSNIRLQYESYYARWAEEPVERTEIGPVRWSNDYSKQYRVDRMKYAAIAESGGFDFLVSDSPLHETGELIGAGYLDVVGSKVALAVIGLHSRITGSLLLPAGPGIPINHLFRSHALYHLAETVFTSKVSMGRQVSQLEYEESTPVLDLITRFVHLLKSRDFVLISKFSIDDQSIFHDIRYQFDSFLLMMGAVLDALAHYVAKVLQIDPEVTIPTFTVDGKFVSKLRKLAPDVAKSVECDSTNRAFLELHRLLRKSIHRNNIANVGYQELNKPPVQLVTLTNIEPRKKRYLYEELQFELHRGYLNGQRYFPAIEIGDAAETLLCHCIRFCVECFDSLNATRGIKPLPITRFRDLTPEYLREVAALVGIEALQDLVPSTCE